MNVSRNLHWFIYAIFCLSCARQSSPTGGPKDTIPPVLIKSVPPNESIHFKAKELQLEFSEDVILNSPKEQLIVTPSISKDYKITYRKNIVTLTFAEPLEDSTTYTFNFRESVQDITEKNPVRNLQLAYSTGNYLDSLSIEGSIYNMLRGTKVPDATLALHLKNDTFNIFEHPTVYFTKTDKEGKFKISHLKPNTYFIYAFEDKNRNLIVNSRTESYGFISDYQQLTDTLADVSIGVVRLDASPLKITSARPYNTYFNIRTTKNLRTFDLFAPDSSILSYTFGENNANIRLYQTTDQDSLEIHLLAFDSLDARIDTTLYAKYNTRQVTPENFNVAVQSSLLLADKGELTATLSFTKPVGETNFDSIFFQVDSLTRIPFEAGDLRWDHITRKLVLQKQLDRKLYLIEDTDNLRAARTAPQTPQKAPTFINKFHFGKGAFISIENDTSKSLSQVVTPMRAGDLTIIHIDIRTSEKSFLVQLVDSNNKVVKEVKNEPKTIFYDVVPGEYQIRLIVDRNDNGRWDAGNYFMGEEPEKVIYYHGPDGSTKVKGVKPNWEIGTEGEMFITY